VNKKQISKAHDEIINGVFKMHGNGAQILIRDVTKIFSEAKERYLAGESPGEVMKELVAKYRTN